MKCIVSIKSLQDNPYFHDKAKLLFSNVVYLDERPTSEVITNVLPDCDVFIIGAREKITSEVASKADKLPKIIGTLSVGLDHLDIEYLRGQGVEIINSPTANVLSVAEHVMATALSLKKRLAEGNHAVNSDKGRTGMKEMPTELYGKTMGLIGYGKISKATAKLASCFGMKVVSTSLTRTSGHEDGISFLNLNDLLSKSDIVSISVPLTDTTKNIINKDNIHLAKKDSVIINTSREEITDFDAVFDALNEGHLSGFVIDADNIPEKLSHLENVIATPHIAGLTNEASDRLDNELIDNIEEFLGRQ